MQRPCHELSITYVRVGYLRKSDLCPILLQISDPSTPDIILDPLSVNAPWPGKADSV